jgi:predicted regulator of Ras-like GTPase activity (Roadblock/LC7/MglB family)
VLPCSCAAESLQSARASFEPHPLLLSLPLATSPLPILAMDYGAAAGSDDVNPPRLFINWTVLQQLLQANTDGQHIKHTLSVETEETAAGSGELHHRVMLTADLSCALCSIRSLLKLDGSLLTSSYATPASKAAASSSSSSDLVSSTPSSSPPPPASSSSGSSSSPAAPEVAPKILGALVANIFKTAESNGINCLQAQQLNMMVLDCEQGLVAVSRLSRFLICIYAAKGIDTGMLRLKMNELLVNLQPLNRVYAQ